MYDNVFVGEIANKQPKRILILGESHYEEDGKISGTDSVVKHLALNGNDDKTQFYKNIMRTFGYEITEENRKKFWNKVYCGNYIDDPCGKGEDNPAKKLISDNRIKYNDSLFNFINENKIDIVFCFSRLVYNNLPGFTKGESEETPIKHNSMYLNKFTYQPNCKHKNCNAILNRQLIVFGLRHPSSHFSPEIYWKYFKSSGKDILF